MAASRGEVETAESLLRDNPGLDVNAAVEQGVASLHAAALTGHTQVIKLLLAHPLINVNLQCETGFTSFSVACAQGHVMVARLLLKDPRVDVSLPDAHLRTPLWLVSCLESHDLVEWLIASGKDFGDMDTQMGERGYTALEIARRGHRRQVVSLLERFRVNPAQTRHEVCAKLIFPGVLAADLFALVIFLCEGLLQPRPARVKTRAYSAAAAADAVRFFAIASKLPMELQMMCHRVVGSAKDSILSKESEAAFRSLARVLLSHRRGPFIINA